MKTKPELIKQLAELEEEDLISILEAARVALSHTEINEHVAEAMDMTDEDQAELHKKLEPILQ